MAKPVDGKLQGFTDIIKVFFMALQTRAIVRNSIFFHTTIITLCEFLVNRLLEQDHGHYDRLNYEAQPYCDDVEHVSENHGSKEQ